jgi:trimeric autotransporter adhesin
MKKTILLLCVLCAFAAHTFAQSLAINTDGSTANVSALLDVKSSNKGVLIPRLTAVQRIAIATPANGLLVYDTDSTSFTYYNGTAWLFLKGINTIAPNWNTTGNTGTTATNFMGTTDAQDLRFKIDNTPYGYFNKNKTNTALGEATLQANTTGISNVAYGANALTLNTGGNGNTANGVDALKNNNTASYNNAFGYGALATNTGAENTAVGTSAAYNNTTGSSNIAVGNYSLFKNTIGVSNVAMGNAALYNNTEKDNLVAIGDSALFNNGIGAGVNPDYGSYNTAVGKNALYANTKGFANTAIGYKALQNDTTGTYNTAVGTNSLRENRNGAYNTGLGTFSLRFNTSGSFNTGLGFQCLNNNTTGAGNLAAGMATLPRNTTGSENSAVGVNALFSNITGNGNTANGYQSLFRNDTGYANVANGFQAMFENTRGAGNSATGYQALVNNTTGNNNTADGAFALLSNTTGYLNAAFGTSADVNSNNLVNATAIGAYAKVGCTNCMVLGTNAPVGGVPLVDKVKVGIGTSNPIADLHIKQINESYPTNGNGGLLLERKNTTDAWNIFTDLGNDLDFNFNGSAKAYINDATGAYTVVSDVRMKNNVTPITNILPTLLQLQPKTYYYNNNKADAPLSYGFIAQEVEKLFPAFVTTKGADNMKAIAYQNFSVIAVQAIKEQQVIIENQNEKINNQNVRINSQNEKINNQEKINADLLKRIVVLEEKIK